MDLLEVVTCLLMESSYFLTSHQALAISCISVGCLLLFRIYNRMTVGMCHCATTMVGKTVIITGGNAGIGKETARELAKRGARVILACRSSERAQMAVNEIVKSTGNPDVCFKQLDLNSFISVREFAKNILDTEVKLDVLINNAGISGSRKKMLTRDGNEIVMQSNFLGHFLLTNLLLDRLKENAPTRIINVTSNSYRYGNNEWKDINSDTKYSQVQAYPNSKLANVYFTKELAKRLERTGVTVNCLHPGVVKTEISKTYSCPEILFRLLCTVIGKTPAEGAQTTIHLTLCKALEKVTGKFFRDCKETKLSKVALDDDSSTRLWTLAQHIVGL